MNALNVQMYMYFCQCMYNSLQFKVTDVHVFLCMYFRLVCSIETCMVVDEWEWMTRENELTPEELRVEVPKLEDMTIHNWQAAAIGALHEATEAHLLSKLIKY